ncbi:MULTISPECIES: VC0807 family protein [Streptomyces]|uniref:Intracellular septation protein A n=1 Tax=Streptomyces rimosus subsp. rimosus TaxID=132474 RepID=A0ABY3YXP1_STRRM|nr:MULTISPECIES: VC0807 family protein [Streptomyces]KOG68048.1 membrane protein [Kitasatospora aureofaciens]KEF06521.1 membrane protein [Streptomyces rimosus]KEF21563.1 membrane protein [Streptomyces rimosus]KOT34688.1 membrane protein [Streptomyces sp. NRRL WC-3701]KOT42899.1 membrane protein [Streptomyces rimosus subsp. rimosus]
MDSQTRSGTEAAPGTGTATAPAPRPKLEGPRALLLDAGVPIASYYLLTGAFGLSTLAALAWSGALPAARSLWSLVRERRLNAVATLMTATNIIGLLLSLVAGDERLMMAKDSAVSSTFGLAVLVSALIGRPLMAPVLKPWITKGDAARSAAWDRLTAESAWFRRVQRRHSAVWGAALLGECVARVIGAFTLPVDTMVWLGTVMLMAAMVLAIVASGVIGIDKMEKLVRAEAAAEAAPAPADAPAPEVSAAPAGTAAR